MNTLLIAVILISGYVYVTLCLETRYRYKRSVGWDAYFFVATWGAVFVCVAWVVCTILGFLGVYRWLINGILHFFHLGPDALKRVFPISFDGGNSIKDLKSAVWGMTSVALAAFCGWRRKKRTEKGDRRLDAIARIVSTSPEESFLMEAAVRQFPVIITLSSRKFYVGIVICPSFENGDFTHIELLLLLSGYRDKGTLTTNITTNYRRHYQSEGIVAEGLGGLSLEDFRILVAKREVESISFFDPDTYSVFKAHEEEDKEQCRALNKNFQPKP
ncbi:hypothetical protein ACM0T4_003567 [Escherichia coli]